LSGASKANGHTKDKNRHMQREVISNCPVCDSQLTVTRLHCNTCGTTIEGEFTVGRFSKLNREQYALLESFLRSRGNLRELERELGVSYPTVRNRVEALLRALDLADGPAIPVEPPHVDVPAATPAAPPAATVDAATRRSILERLARHELSAEQAAAALRGEPVGTQETTNSLDIDATKEQQGEYRSNGTTSPAKSSCALSTATRSQSRSDLRAVGRSGCR